jgi:hypothetical protein
VPHCALSSRSCARFIAVVGALVLGLLLVGDRSARAACGDYVIATGPGARHAAAHGAMPGSNPDGHSSVAPLQAPCNGPHCSKAPASAPVPAPVPVPSVEHLDAILHALAPVTATRVGRRFDDSPAFIPATFGDGLFRPPCA